MQTTTAPFDAIHDYLSRQDSTVGFVGYDDFLSICLDMLLPGSVMEIGAGRNPLALKVCRERSVRYIANDIDSAELDRIAGAVEIAEFDIGGHVPVSAPTVDLILSRSVLEHVRDVRTALSNSAKLLNPGGIALHFAPTLFSVPFVANRILPERLSSAALQLVRPRDKDLNPKFPAFYDHCRSTENNRQLLADVVRPANLDIVAYYNHDYYGRVPLLRNVAPHLHKLLARRDLRPLSAYAFFIVTAPG